MMFARSEGAKPLDARWHEKRQRARETGFRTESFSEYEINRWDLDTAQIDGSDNPRVFTWKLAIDIFGVNGTDIRTLKDR